MGRLVFVFDLFEIDIFANVVVHLLGRSLAGLVNCDVTLAVGLGLACTLLNTLGAVPHIAEHLVCVPYNEDDKQRSKKSHHISVVFKFGFMNVQR